MIHGLDAVRRGLDVSADVVVVGSGAGGAVAAANLAHAGMQTVLLEAGRALLPEDMRVDTPTFMARNYWEGGLRFIGGSSTAPALQARCLGGSTVVNSAIMLPLPAWVRQAWQTETGLDLFTSPQLDAAYQRVFERTRVAPTPMAVMGRRNLAVRDALAAVDTAAAPLPRAVVDCEGCAHCFTGCASGRKQSVDRSYVVDAVNDGATVFTTTHVERVLTEGSRVVGVEGHVIDPDGFRPIARFRVRAPKVVLAAGALQTPVLLLQSGINPKRKVGATFAAHVTGAVIGIMDEVTEPWFGATQGMGAWSRDIQGLKYESLWAPPAALFVRFGDVGHCFLQQLHEVQHAAVVAVVYRARVSGSVRARRDGTPAVRMHVPDEEARTLYRGLKVAADGLLRGGARYVHSGIRDALREMRNERDTETLLSPKLGAKHLAMTASHLFSSCRMSERDGVVDRDGAVHGMDGLYLADASIFPSPSAANPQATVMALADIVSRRLGELHDAS